MFAHFKQQFIGSSLQGEASLAPYASATAPVRLSIAADKGSRILSDRWEPDGCAVPVDSLECSIFCNREYAGEQHSA